MFPSYTSVLVLISTALSVGAVAGVTTFNDVRPSARVTLKPGVYCCVRFFSIQLKVASPVPVRVLPTFTNLSEISRLHRILPNQLARQWYLCCCNG